jgi:hypothetical protein
MHADGRADCKNEGLNGIGLCAALINECIDRNYKGVKRNYDVFN